MEHDNVIKYKKWSREEIEFLVKNYNRMTLREIARHLGRTYYSVRYKARELGLPRKLVGIEMVFANNPSLEKKVMKLFNEGYTVKEISRLLGLSYYPLLKYLKKKGIVVKKGIGSTIRRFYKLIAESLREMLTERKVVTREEIVSALGHMVLHRPRVLSRIASEIGAGYIYVPANKFNPTVILYVKPSSEDEARKIYEMIVNKIISRLRIGSIKTMIVRCFVKGIGRHRCINGIRFKFAHIIGRQLKSIDTRLYDMFAERLHDIISKLYVETSDEWVTRVMGSD